MAEFCLECMNEYILEGDEKLTESEVTTEFDLCEGCGEWKPCVISIKKKNIFGIFGD